MYIFRLARRCVVFHLVGLATVSIIAVRLLCYVVQFTVVVCSYKFQELYLPVHLRVVTYCMWFRSVICPKLVCVDVRVCAWMCKCVRGFLELYPPVHLRVVTYVVSFNYLSQICVRGCFWIDVVVVFSCT